VATTVLQGFLQLKRNLEITSLQSATASSRQANVRAVVKASLDINKDFLTGSYQRSTMIAPLSTADVDIFMVLDSKYFSDYQRNPAGLLDRVRAILLRSYNNSAVSRNGQAVTIKFTDFAVDTVPAFNRQGGGYLIPSSYTSTWISTNPTQHVAIWSTANTWNDGNLVPLIKMLKQWNKVNGDLMTSFHLECLILQVLTNIKISSYSSAARYFFDHARGTINYQCLDPAGFGGDVSQYLDTQSKRDAVISRMQRAYDNAIQAEQYEAVGQISHAFDRWRQTFGDWFPVYG
jgi:hypothetical protein